MTGAGKSLAKRAALLGLAAACLLPGADSQAASRACRRLEAGLAASAGGGNPAQIRKYDAAIARQGDEIARARSRARSAGCGFFLFGASVAECASLNATLDRMNNNLDSLRRKRAELAGGGSRRDRARILAALDANGCRDELAERSAPAPGDGAGLFGRLYDDDARERGQLDQPGPDELGPAPGRETRLVLPRYGGTFRTLCVRTCDGYFFPMSNAAALGDFERDQKNCESSCPGTDIEVFYTRGLTDDSASMTSAATGKPYSELPTAYLYKRTDIPRPQGCGCNAARDFSVIAGNPAAADRPKTQADDSSSFVTPAAIDPEPAAAAAKSGPPVSAPTPAPATALDSDQKVRVVGPRFLPDPAGAIDLRAPARKEAR